MSSGSKVRCVDRSAYSISVVNRLSADLLYKADSGGHDCSLHTRSAPASDYHIFCRTFPRIKQKPRRGERRTVEEVIDQRLRAIELVKNEPGARRALSLAKWISEYSSGPISV